MAVNPKPRVTACLLLALALPACRQVRETAPADPVVARFECSRSANDVAFSPDGRFLVAACGGWSGPGGVKVWNFAERRLVATLAETTDPWDYVQRVVFSPDGKLLALGNRKGQVTIWDVARKQLLSTVRRGGGSPTALSFSPDGKQLVVAYDHSVFLYDFNPKRSRRLATHDTKKDYFGSAAFSPDGRLLVTAERNAIRIWDPATGEVIRRLPAEGNKYFLLFSPDGRFLISGGAPILGPKSVGVWDVTAERKVIQLNHFRQGIFSVAVSSSGNLFALGGGNYGPGGDISIWTLPAGQERAYVSFGRFPIDGLAFSPDDRFLAAASADGVVLVYTVERLHGPQIQRQGYFLCGEIQVEEGHSYLVPLSKGPPPMTEEFHYNWKLPVINAEEFAHLDGVPIILLDWEVHRSASEHRIAVREFRELGPKSKQRSALENYVVFADIQNPGWNRGQIIKIFADGSFVATNNPGVCMAYGSLSDLDPPQTFAEIRAQLLANGLLTLPDKPLTHGTDHYRIRFVELSVNGISYLRSDARLVRFDEKDKKYEKFDELYGRFEPTISKLLRAGRREPEH